MKIQKKDWGGGWGLGSGGRVGGSQGGWEQRSEACVKIQTKTFFFFWWWWGGGGGWVGGFRVDVDGKVKLL